MERVPDDCTQLVLGFLDAPSLRATRLVCSALRDAAHAFAESKTASVACALQRLRRDLFFRKMDIRLASLDVADARHELRQATDAEMRHEALLFLDAVCSHISVATSGFSEAFVQSRVETRRLRARFGFSRETRVAIASVESDTCAMLTHVI